MSKPTGFDERKARAQSRLENGLIRCNAPVVLSSFGKESLCLLALLDELGIRVEVAYFELGAVPEAHRFARQLIAKINFPITLLYPHKTVIVAGEAGADLAYEFNLESGDFFQIVGATFDHTPSAQLSCGLSAGLVREARHAAYCWNLIISGRRSCDVDPTVGSLAINTESEVLEHGTEILMPLLDWTDEDVAFFLSENPKWKPDSNRYVLIDGALRNRVDNRQNPDWASICVRCLAARSGEQILCPLSLIASNDHRLETRLDLLDAVPATVMF